MTTTGVSGATSASSKIAFLQGDLTEMNVDAIVNAANNDFFYHMRGAADAFAAQGFEVMRAPMGHHASAPRSVLDFLPNAGGMRDSSLALREFLRRVWYAVRL